MKHALFSFILFSAGFAMDLLMFFPLWADFSFIFPGSVFGFTVQVTHTHYELFFPL